MNKREFTKDKYLFRDLELSSKNKAIGDYIDGWLFTHPEDDLQYIDVSEILDESCAYYTKDGTYIGDEDLK